MAASNTFACKINPHTTSADIVTKKKLCLPLNSKREPIFPDLKNIQLKDYTGKYKHKNIGERSPYVTMCNASGKQILVKKHRYVGCCVTKHKNSAVIGYSE